MPVGDAAEGDGVLVVGAGQDLVQPGGGDWLGRLRGRGPGGQATGCQFLGQARQGPVPGGVAVNAKRTRSARSGSTWITRDSRPRASVVRTLR